MAPKRKAKASLDEFRNSTSQFREEEQLALNIVVNYTDNERKIFRKDIDEELLRDLKDLLLENYTGGKILEYEAKPDDGLNKIQRKFVQKLKLIILNNNPYSVEKQDGRYIDDFLTHLLEVANFDDGIELTLRPCSLRLEIGDTAFAAIADKEGRRGTALTWIVQEDKHSKSSSYKHGDLQLACAMIAAAQLNYNRLEEVYPEKMMGIKVVADRFYFCSMEARQDYLDELRDGLPESSITLNLYPKSGYIMRIPDERTKILKCLDAMRKEIIELEKR